MSGLGGGAAAKLGDRYEAWWTIGQLLLLVEGDLDLVRLEPAGEEGAGAEEWVQVGGRRCYDQAKDVPSRGNWSPHALAIGPITKLRPHLDAGHDIKLILSTPATAFQALIRVADVATSLQNFEELLTKDQMRWFDTVCRDLGCDSEVVVDYLRRSTVEVWSREVLHDRIRRQAAFAFVGDRDATIDHLAGFVIDHLHQTVSAMDVVDFLATRGVRRNLFVGDPTVLESYRLTGSRFAEAIRSRARSASVDRPELEGLLALVSDPATPQIVVVDGGAGSGKSSLVADAMSRLRSLGWATCGVRMDLVPPATLTAAALGAHLGYSDSPGLIAAALSRTVQTMLVIDQLDAVGEFSGRLSQPFEAVLEVLEELALGPSAKVVLVVRTIDLKNDARLRAMLQDDQRVAQFEIGSFTDDQLDGGLTSLGLEPAEVDIEMKELLRVPLHFAVFAQLSPEARTRMFASLPHLYQAYTAEIRRQIEVRSPGFGWDAAVRPIVRYVSENETLAVPVLALAGAPPGALAQLESHGVVVRSEDHVGFLHETYFDFLFAADFLDTRQDLLDFIVTSGQQLFRRTQVRQILVHLHGVAPKQLAMQVRQILSDVRVRSHLKDVVVSVFGLVGASEQNWAALEDLVLGSGWIAEHLAASLAGPAWFDVVDSAGRWPGLLSDPELSAKARSLLVACAPWRPVRAAELVEPHVGTSEEWRADIALLVERSFGVEQLPFVLRLVESGDLDDVRLRWRGGSDFWSLVEELVQEHPGDAARLLGAYLERGMVRANAEGLIDPFSAGVLDADSRSSDTVLQDLALATPGPLIDAVLPLVLAVSESAAVDEGDGSRIVPRWRYRHRGAQYQVDLGLIHALDTAFASLASSQCDRVTQIARTLAASDIEVLRFLACRAFTESCHSDEAIDWLLADNAHLSLGWSDSHAWATRELIEAATATCSGPALDRLTEVLMDYTPRWEFSADPDRRCVGASQQVLLSAIPVARRSSPVSRRLAELDRRFPGRVLGPPERGAVASFVGPPISPEGARHMSDAQWLGAIAKWNSDRTNWTHLPPTGGAPQLASVLQTQAEEDPERFASLAMRFDATTHDSYPNAIVRGAAPGLGDAILGALLTRLADVFGSTVGRGICWAINELPDEADEACASLVARYAMDPDPAEDTSHDHEPGKGAFQLESAAINTTRGLAARACASILFKGDANLDLLRGVTERLVADPTMAVRTAASTAVLALSNHDKPSAQDQIDRLLDHPNIDIFDSRMVEEAMIYAAMWDGERMAPQIQRALDGPAHISRHGGFVWAVLSNRGELPQSLAGEVSELQAAARVGAAEVMAGWIDGDPESLSKLVADPDPLVAKEAVSFLQHLEGLPASIIDTVLEAFAGSDVFTAHIEEGLHRLSRLPETSPHIALAMCERAVEIARRSGAEVHEMRFAASRSVLAVVVREYRRCPDLERDRCLDIIDRLCELRVFGLDEALSHTRAS